MEERYTDFFLSTEKQLHFQKNCNIYIKKYVYGDISDISYHDHSGDFELCLITYGYGYHYVNDYVKEVSKGNLLLIDPESRHSLFPVDHNNSTQLQVINCVFNRSSFEILGGLTPILENAIDYFTNLSESHPLLKSYNCLDKDLATFCQPLMYHVEELSKNGNDINVQTITTSIALMVLEIYRKLFDAKPKKENSIQKPLLSRAVEMIQTNYLNPDFMISDIYHKLFMSKSYLCTMFREHLRTSPLQMLNNLRIKYACERIHETGHCSKTLYQEAGYSEYNTFYINFKKVTGFSIRDYVKALTIFLPTVRSAKNSQEDYSRQPYE